MSIPYEKTGRTSQKARTRDALVAAARELLAEGAPAAVERAADRAGISRTTAYRYFPNQRTLLVAAYPEIDAASLLGEDAPEDPVERLDIVLEHLARQLLDHEPELRAALRLSLEVPLPDAEALVLRKGRALTWIEDALAPLHGSLDPDALDRLALSIRAAIGIEPLVWLTDVGGLASKDAVDLMRSSARTLMHAAVTEAGD